MVQYGVFHGLQGDQPDKWQGCLCPEGHQIGSYFFLDTAWWCTFATYRYCIACIHGKMHYKVFRSNSLLSWCFNQTRRKFVPLVNLFCFHYITIIIIEIFLEFPMFIRCIKSQRFIKIVLLVSLTMVNKINTLFSNNICEKHSNLIRNELPVCVCE